MSRAAPGGDATRPGQFPNLRVVEHPLLTYEIERLRDGNTPRAEFRRGLTAVSRLLAVEATRDLTEAGSRATGLEGAAASSFAGERVTVVPILRAGLGMSNVLLQLIPGAAVGHIGLERDARTKRPREYYLKLPTDAGGPVFVVDPMIATGGSATYALDTLLASGIGAERIRLVAVVAAPEGVAHLLERHPEVPILAAALDSHLNDAKQIVPGIGDAGDRLFGTV